MVFEDAPFSYIRLKHYHKLPFVLGWEPRVVPNVDTSFVRILLSLYMTDPRN